ncbi:MAG TPA: NAD(P)(+) transhydrogenase (Re/Si-specific) subunit beta, partial [Candidatus Acidoferrum sp.]|nr:NAD(P)(+) transhydrogenase (Re/Si-specific) subunit beta [Candidatus Acidoferrum sp.]
MIAAYFTQLSYIAAAALFILALKWLSHPATARRGVRVGEIGMALAIAGTLVLHEIVSYRWIVVGFVVGGLIGWPMGAYMPMTHVPQRTALSHAFGALAAATVGTSEYYLHTGELTTFTMAILNVEVILGFLTFTGSLMAAGKLQEWLPSRPIVYKGQNVVNLSLLAVTIGIAVYLVLNPGHTELFPIVAALSLLFGVLLIIPIGGADMPTVISLLNSYAGLSAAAMGFVLNNNLLIVAGALDGSSGFILSVIMCRAMNRSFTNVLFGGFGQVQITAGAAEKRNYRSATVEEAAAILEAAGTVIIVPGYGMAVAQAQH